MDPDVAFAIPTLEREGALPAPVAARLLRVARGDLVSLRPELLTLYLAGVMLIMAGVGVLVMLPTAGLMVILSAGRRPSLLPLPGISRICTSARVGYRARMR